MKKTVAVIVALCLMLAVVPFAVSAATGGTTGDCSWSVSGTVLTVSGNGAMADYDFQKIENKNYSTAPWPSDITEVKIEDGVTYIGKCSFVGCANLTKVTMADSVLSTGTYVFQECVNLSDVKLSSKLTKINDYIFYKCYALKNLNVPQSVTSYGKAVFYDAGLQSIEFSDNVTSLDEYLFRGCKDLASVKFGKKISTISSSVFLDCVALKEITVPDTVTIFDTSVFKGCTGLETVKLDSNVVMLPMFAFAGCVNLKTVYLSAGIVYIDMTAFQNCNAITNVYYGGDEADIYVDETENGSLLSADWEYNYVPTASGVTVSGTVKSFGSEQDAVTIQLIEDDTENAVKVASDKPTLTAIIIVADDDDGVAYETTVTGNSAAYEIKDVENGKYILKVMKKNHVTRSYEVTVSGSAVTVDAEIRLFGDVNGDGFTDKKDANAYKKHISRASLFTGYIFDVANINGDEYVDKKDSNFVKKHINRSALLY